MVSHTQTDSLTRDVHIFGLGALLLTASLLVFSNFARAKSFQAESGANQVTLIELYSSEGCSSCPPADKQLAKLRKHKSLFKSFVPIEFHVDYWNYLGWTDPFSNKQFTMRQKKYASKWGNRSVYTPGFVVNGTEHVLWTPLPKSKTKNQPGNLKVTSTDSQTFKVSFTPGKSVTGKTLSLHGALLGNGLKTKVPTGENAGETLNHEFVVLRQKKISLKKNKKGVFEANVKLDKPKKSKAKSYSVAFWVSSPSGLAPIQAVGGDI